MNMSGAADAGCAYTKHCLQLRFGAENPDLHVHDALRHREERVKEHPAGLVAQVHQLTAILIPDLTP